MDFSNNNLIDVTEELITATLSKHASDLNKKYIDIPSLVSLIKNNLTEQIDPNEFYNYIADYCVCRSSYHPDYNRLASRIIVDRLHSNTNYRIADVARELYLNTDCNGLRQSLISDSVRDMMLTHSEEIDSVIDWKRDYQIDYFGIKTLERSYLLKKYVDGKKKIIERPQHMFMRVALGIHGTRLMDAIETYNLLSERYFTHASPTLFNAGTNRPQLSSCFLFGVGDNIDSILDQIKTAGIISKWSGGIGIHLSSVRAKKSIIRGTNGQSDGIIPLCIVLNKEARYINQGGNRNGSIACYLEPWHPDIFDFCDLRKAGSGSDDNRARDLFLALWVPDLFMRRVEADEMWSLFCPDECVGLEKAYGVEFEALYKKYEKEKKYKKQVKARKLWMHILDCQIESGFPYVCYKDSANAKSNQKNLGTIRSSNLCAEIIEYSDEQEVACCNLASICLPRFITKDSNGNIIYDYHKLGNVARVCVRNLNKIIDINYYPSYQIRHADQIRENLIQIMGISKNVLDNNKFNDNFEIGKSSNLSNRPIGIGIQGLADVFNLLGLPYESKEALDVNTKIMETIYYNSLDESCMLAKVRGTYKTFAGSPFSEGILQYHMWGLTNNDLLTKDMFDWNGLINRIKEYGTTNSLITALMPTASTSQIMGCYESFEPYMSNLFVRTTLAGEFIIINANLIKQLVEKDIWNDDIRKMIIIKNGSIADIPQIPDDIKRVYKTAFEIKLKSIIDQSVARGKFVDQSQSMNIFIAKPNFTILNSSHFYAWKQGLKTGMYYCRTTPSVNPGKFGIDISDIQRLLGKTNIIDIIAEEYGITLSEKEEKEEKVMFCRRIPGKVIGEEGCVMCSS
jgi:ribonucleoside-diphosphate reductase alpha chain